MLTIMPQRVKVADSRTVIRSAREQRCHTDARKNLDFLYVDKLRTASTGISS